jgi:hypothetical protein
MRIGSVAVLLCVTAGCGGTENTAPWVGSWVSSLNETEVCPTGSHVTPLNGAFTIAAGPVEGDVVTQPPNGCNLTWTVRGSSATLKGSQTCTVPGSVGGTWTATFTSGTLTLNGGQITGADQGAGILNLAGAMQSCTFTQSGSFNKS